MITLKGIMHGIFGKAAFHSYDTSAYCSIAFSWPHFCSEKGVKLECRDLKIVLYMKSILIIQLDGIIHLQIVALTYRKTNRRPIPCTLKVTTCFYLRSYFIEQALNNRQLSIYNNRKIEKLQTNSTSTTY